MGSTYGDWLREQREAAGLTQQQLADAAVMTRSHIAHIEAGRRIPSKEDARRLDKALDTGNVLSSFRPGADGRPVGSHFEAALVFEQQATMIREFAQPPVAYVEAMRTGKVHDDPAMVGQFQDAYHLALGDALPLKESLALMRATAKDYGHHD
ncbi:multiprotein-bridging factor 1 family protein [Streptomyces lydicus]|uniref:multiprotein-bridging factor 1 family protein n=1 Tax=Streptomyces lydicus TaxID=47763 RepID=UPI0037BD580B